jgi:hypothetical protein
MKRRIAINLFTSVAFASATIAGVNKAEGEFAPESYMKSGDIYMGAFHNKKMPPFSVEMAPKEQVAVKTPWQVPRSGDKLYDASAERAIQKQINSTMLANQKIIVRFYKRGVFQAYVLEPAWWYLGAAFFSHNLGVSPNQ